MGVCPTNSVMFAATRRSDIINIAKLFRVLEAGENVKRHPVTESQGRIYQESLSPIISQPSLQSTSLCALIKRFRRYSPKSRICRAYDGGAVAVNNKTTDVNS